jgi:2-hydroxycyclohexanecarboxyl-CoA dehydrogenase
VSGGGGDIGTAICRALHADGWGLAIGYVSRQRAESLAAELAAQGPPAKAVPLDLTDRAQVRAGLGELLEAEGHIDALVLNAGWNQARPFLDTDEQQWRTTVAVNLVGPMLAVQMCLPSMVQAGSGAIVAITSEAARVGDAGNAVYSAAKAGLTSFLRTIVREHGRDGVRANAVAPGPIETSLLRHAFSDDEAADAAIAKLTRLVPLRRLGRPAEVAAAVRYLVSEGAHVTGQQLGVGGGVVM